MTKTDRARVWTSCASFESFEKHCNSCHIDQDEGYDMCTQHDFEHEYKGKKYDVIIDGCCGFKEWSEENDRHRIHS